jgi:hypothetical protein
MVLNGNGGCGRDSSGSGQGEVADFCKQHSNENFRFYTIQGLSRLAEEVFTSQIHGNASANILK